MLKSDRCFPQFFLYWFYIFPCNIGKIRNQANEQAAPLLLFSQISTKELATLVLLFCQLYFYRFLLLFAECAQYAISEELKVFDPSRYTSEKLDSLRVHK